MFNDTLKMAFCIDISYTVEMLNCPSGLFNSDFSNFEISEIQV